MASTNEDFEKFLREVFKMFDKDGNGTISASELGDAIKQAEPQRTQAEVDAQVQEILKALDRNKDGCLSFEEFKVGLTSTGNQ